MKCVLKVLEWVNLLSLLLFIPFLIFGKDIFILTLENPTDDVSILCLNQMVIAVFITFFTMIYARVKKIYKTRYVVDIFKNCERHILILTGAFYIAGVTVGFIFFTSNIMEYLIVCFIHALSVIVCSNANKRIKKPPESR